MTSVASLMATGGLAQLFAYMIINGQTTIDKIPTAYLAGTWAYLVNYGENGTGSYTMNDVPEDLKVSVYVYRINAGQITIDDVPDEYKAAVQAALNS